MNILCNNISFSYGSKQVLKDISYKFEKGYLYGIIGPNGSGKTTILKVLSGILKTIQGYVCIDGMNIDELNIREIAKNIAVVNQSTLLDFIFTVEDIIKMGRYAHIGRFSRESSNDKKVINSIIKKFNLEQLRNRDFNELSGGEQQKVIIARALAQQSKIIMLDEPTSHLDLSYQIEFMELLKQYVNDGIIVIIVIHDLNLAIHYCDQLILLNEGKIESFGSPEEVITRENIKSVYNIDVIIKKNMFSKSIYITPLRTSVGGNISNIYNSKIKKIHIIAGGGTAINIMPKLSKYEVSVGVVNVLDEDYICASELDYKIISEGPFSPISEKSCQKLEEILDNVDITILTNIPIGKGNLDNLKILYECDRNIIILEENLIEERDFTNGIATEIYNKLKLKKNVKIISNLEELFNLIKYLEVDKNES